MGENTSTMTEPSSSARTPCAAPEGTQTLSPALSARTSPSKEPLI